MNISCQSIINTERPMQGITDLQSAGLERIFLPVYVEFPVLGERTGERESLRKYSPETIARRYGPVIETCREHGIQIAFLKTPGIPPKADLDAALPMLEISIIQSLELCRKAGCSFLLIELPAQFADGVGGNKAVYDYLMGTAAKACKYSVKLLLKNQARNAGGHLVRGFCSETVRAVQWTDGLNNKLGYDAFGFCVDIGTCNACGNDPQTFMSALGSRIKAVILRDNDGRGDASMLPFTCVPGTDWLGVIRGLRDIDFDGELAVDFSSTYKTFSPLVRPALYLLVKRTAEYFRWQVGIESDLKKHGKFVLFGAGNMCRNYMKCYGEKYPPLFICDNNPKLWGTTLEGLEVRKPEELRHLPGNCCVVICNIYYREIQAQLREMGIENIGYFNDEYMPLF